MEISEHTRSEIEALYQAYLGLSEFEQCILKILSATYFPVGITKLNTLLSLVNQAGVFSRVIINKLSQERREALVNDDFVIHDNSGLRINPLLANHLTSECVGENKYLVLTELAQQIAPQRSLYDCSGAPLENTCLARDMYFSGNGELDSVLKFDKNPQVLNIDQHGFLVELCFLPFQQEKFEKLSENLQYQSFALWYKLNCINGQSSDYLIELLTTVSKKIKNNKNLQYLKAELHLKALKLDKFRQTLNGSEASCYGLQLLATDALLNEEFQTSEALFAKAILAKNKYTRRKNQFLDGDFGLFYKLCLMVLASRDSNYFEIVVKQINHEENSKSRSMDSFYLMRILGHLVRCLSDGSTYNIPIDLSNSTIQYTHISKLAIYLGGIWCGESFTKDGIRDLKKSCQFFSKIGNEIYAQIAKQIISSVNQTPKKAEATKSESTIPHFPSLITRKPAWDLALEKLIALSPESTKLLEKKENDAEKQARLVWLMSFDFSEISFSAREQKLGSKGWSKGRPVALKRLAKEHEKIAHLNAADHKMCEAISVYRSWDYYGSSEYSLQGLDALLAAKDLEHLFLENDLTCEINLEQKEPELVVSEQGQNLLLSIADLPRLLDGYSDDVPEQRYSIIERSEGNFAFTVFNTSHLQVAEIVGEGGLLIPKEAKQKVLESVSAIAPLLNIQSDLNELDTGLEKVECDRRLIINIQPLSEGLEFSCVVMPFGQQGPAFMPAQGKAKLTSEIDGKRVATERDFSHEESLLDALDQHCPAFLSMPGHVLKLGELEQALSALEQLERCIETDPESLPLLLRWPRGKKFQLSKTLGHEQLSLSMVQKNEWFDISGSLTVDEEQIIELRKLLELTAAASGRFISLDDGKILALSQELRDRLDALNRGTDQGKIHPLASPLIADATAGMRMKTLHAWEQQCKLMHEANNIKTKLPSTLQAELRDYQKEGFDWMTRLAHWRAGACLADDMGLGKTLQALALVLSRATDGPSLVIAPTSVCFNWLEEAKKFAPTLNMVLFADFGDTEQRQKLLRDVGNFDCVVISYGLLQRESEMLSNIRWRTIVADEAQALKNPLAKRSKAAFSLQADFKIITSGTPIENNLSELWSLFRFITPGLLGNLKRFGERFAIPIENAKEDKLLARKASVALKTLIQPFILRRMKNQVLNELPPRTEINIQVELSEKELNFYEALRRNAVDNIAKASETASKGEQRIKMLAELVKLRQACCNPKLVTPETTIPSAKLTALDELLGELKQNKHKALIFSQFVGHLKLIKTHLETREFSYQYLDGSTPQKERKKRVDAFQSGHGDVFLISLKAGGSGLNLTAADFVIHMDPWWNPAVEEQASDRAHRMGQKRPVTIYRLIAKNTIEERIVDLHQHKRDLADKLLTGNEHATKLSVEDMLNLLKETL